MPQPPIKPQSKIQAKRKSSVADKNVDQFLQAVAGTSVASAAHNGQFSQLIFALDATASRQATWDEASSLQAEMFTKTEGLAKLALQLVYFRGFDECKASPWLDNTATLLRMMQKITCVAGRTQISRILKHAIGEARQRPVQALVFIGDAMEEQPGLLEELAGQLKILGLPVFIFQEGHDMRAGATFKNIAQISGGAHCRFDTNAAHQLGLLLNAVAVYAAGGQEALKQLSQQGSKQAATLLEQLK